MNAFRAKMGLEDIESAANRVSQLVRRDSPEDKLVIENYLTDIRLLVNELRKEVIAVPNNPLAVQYAGSIESYKAGVVHFVYVEQSWHRLTAADRDAFYARGEHLEAIRQRA